MDKGEEGCPCPTRGPCDMPRLMKTLTYLLNEQCTAAVRTERRRKAQ